MRENSKPRVCTAGDYAVLEFDDLYFYYGYEHVWCSTHQKFCNRCEDECDTEWAFTVKKKGEYLIKFTRTKDIDQFNVEEQLIFGLGEFIQWQAKRGAVQG